MLWHFQSKQDHMLFWKNPKNNSPFATIGTLFYYSAKSFYTMVQVINQERPWRWNGNKSLFHSEYQQAARVFSFAKTSEIIGLLREYDVKLKGLDSTAPDGELMRELIINTALKIKLNDDNILIAFTTLISIQSFYNSACQQSSISIHTRSITGRSFTGCWHMDSFMLTGCILLSICLYFIISADLRRTHWHRSFRPVWQDWTCWYSCSFIWRQ